MYRDHTVGVVVPAYNEAAHVGDVVRSIPPFVDRIYAVDDRSTDDTWGEITRAASDDGARDHTTEMETVDLDSTLLDGSNGRGRWTALLRARTAEVSPGERIVPIRHADNRGAGGAIKTGYLAALADGVDVVATIDGDGQMDPSQLPRFLDPIVEGAVEYTKGNRFAATASVTEMPVIRLVGNAILTGLTRIASGYWSVSDPQNGYTAIATATLESVGIADLFEYYAYCNELLVRLNVAGAAVEDVPLPASYGDEESHISLDTFVPKVSAMLLRNFLWRLTITYLDVSKWPSLPQNDDRQPRTRSEPTIDRVGSTPDRTVVEHREGPDVAPVGSNGALESASRTDGGYAGGRQDR